MADVTNKTLNVRIKNKYDSYENWAKSEIVLGAGELAIATVTTAQKDDFGNIIQVPNLMIKVGDGSKTFAQLPWLSAKAADVADWAKADTLQASAVSGLGDYIAQYVDETLGISVDTNTVYRLYTEDNKTYKLQSKAAGEADTAYADVEGSTFTIDLSTVTQGIADLKTQVGEGTVSTQIDNKITELNLANTYAAKSHTHSKSEITDFAHNHTKSEITDFAHNHEISEVNGLSAAISDAKKAGTDANSALDAYKITNNKAVSDNTDAIAAITEGATITTFKGIEDQIGTVETGKTVVEMIEAAQSEATYDDTAVKKDISDLKTQVGEGTVSTQIDNKIAELNLGETYASKIAYDTYVAANDKAVAANTAAIEKLNGDDKTEGSVDYKVAHEVAKILNDNDASDIDTLNEIAAWIKNDTAGVGALNEAVTANADAIAAIKKDATITTFKGIEDKIGALTGDNTVAQEIEAAKEAAIEAATYDDAVVKKDISDLKTQVGEGTVSTQIDDKIAAFKNGDFTTEQGRIDDLEDAVEGLANIASTGNVDDLVQTANTYIVFDCGTASTII